MTFSCSRGSSSLLLAPLLVATLLLTSVVATALLILGSQNALAGTFPGTNGKIAFKNYDISNPINSSEIYVMNSDGTGQTRLTNNDAYDDFPSWSPDGTKIAFTSGRDGNSEVYVMNADGTGQTRLTDNAASDFGASWSPDGTKIAFASTRDDVNFDIVGEIYVMNAFDGSEQTNLTNDALGDDIEPSWSPDGTKIAFTSFRDGKWDVYVMKAFDGSEQTNLTPDAAEADVEPSWSPDGTKIAFASNRDGNTEIYVMNADGTATTRLTHSPLLDSRPDFGPKADGQIIIEKEIVGAGADGTFTFTKYPTNPSLAGVPTSFTITTLNGRGAATFNNLLAGGYVNITESNPGPSFQWTDLSCQSVQGNNIINIHPLHSVGITLDAAGGGIVDCKFVDTHVLYPIIDIKPGGASNAINLKTDNTVPVAVLGSPTLDVRTVDISPLTTDAPKFGGSTPQGPVKTNYEDVNKDSHNDLVLKYNTAGLGFTSSSTQGCVTGKLIDGTIITGCDSVKVINK